jgi:hypothetical protein
MRRHTLPLLAFLLLTSATLADGLIIPAKFDIPANKETTYLTAPLRPDGTVDYLRGLEDLLAKDLKPEDNAFFPLLQIAGTGENFIDPAYKAELIKRFHIPESTGQWIRFKPENANDSEELYNCGKAPWSKTDHPRFAEWLDKNQASLAAVADAAKLNRFYVPVWSIGDCLISRGTPNLSQVRDYADALTERAMLRLGSGDLDGCRQDILTTRRLARLISLDPSGGSILWASSVESRASQADIALALSGKANAVFLTAYITQRDQLPPFHTIWEYIDVVDRCTYLDLVTRIARFGLAGNEFPATRLDDEDPERLPFTNDELTRVDFTAVLKKVNTYFDKEVTIIKMEDPAARGLAAKEFVESLPSRDIADDDFAAAKTKNITQAFTGWALARMPDHFRARSLEQKNLTRSILARLTLALAAYHADHNAYPDSLSDLAPKYLPAIPLDPFSSKPFLYQHTAPNFLLYSIGPDLTDDHGAPESQGKGDIVVTSTSHPKP